VSGLAQLPLDEMKLTASLVSDMRRVPLHAKVVRTLVQLAQNLGLRMTAEGVDDAETALALSTLGCERIQGAYVGPPIDTPEVLARCGPQNQTG
jgi:EAL domain-containing protein (putative c-di-GMP-specific phosphodiesterase class I)